MKRPETTKVLKMSEEVLTRIERNLSEQLKWIRLAGMSQLRTVIEQNLKTDDEKLVYELSDGEKSTRDIEKITRVGRTKIGILWKKWYNLGLMERSVEYEGKRMSRSFSLHDVGIEVPSLPQDQAPVQPGTEEFE
jgi:hypothetical protein